MEPIECDPGVLERPIFMRHRIAFDIEASLLLQASRNLENIAASRLVGNLSDGLFQ